MLLRPAGQIRVVVSSHTWKPDFILSGSQVARASRGRRLVLGSETNCAPDNLHGRSILGPERDSQESCFAVNGAALCSLRESEKGRQTRYATRTGPLRGSPSSFLDRRGNWVVPLMILINCSYNVSYGRPPTANLCRARATIFSLTRSRDDVFITCNCSSDSFDSIEGNYKFFLNFFVRVTRYEIFMRVIFLEEFC